MPVIRDVAGKWSWKVSAFDLPIEKGMRIVLNPHVLDNPAETVYRLLDWHYRVTGSEDRDDRDLDLELIVEEVRPGWWERWFTRLPPETQFFFPLITGMLTILLVAVLGGILYLQPTHGLVFVGRHIRGYVAGAIILLFWFVLPSKLNLFSDPPNFRKPFFASLLNMSGWILAGLWLTFAAHPESFHGSDAEYVAYSKTLARSLSTSYWPLLLAALPWISVGFKVLGLDVAEKAAEGLQKIAKKEK